MKLKEKRPAGTRRVRRLEREKRRQRLSGRIKRNIKLVILCIIVLGLTVIPPIFVNNAFGYLPVIVLGLLLVFSRIYVTILKRALVFEEKSDFSDCIRGTDNPFSISLKNRSPLVFSRMEVYFFVSDIFGGEDSTDTAVITLAPYEVRKFSFDIHFDHIGAYEAGLKKVTFSDLFGIFQITLDNEKRYQIRVAPKIFDVAKLHVSNSTFIESKHQLIPTSMDGSDYTGVREYVIGDPIKSIHWKLSARTEVYMTRQYESYGNTGISIIMDFLSPAYDTESMMCVFDGIVETALSVEHYGRSRGMETELLYLNKSGRRKKYSSRGKKDIFELISDLPKVSTAGGKYTALNLLVEEGRAPYSQGNLAFCTSNITSALVRALMDIKLHRKNPILFCIVPDGLTSDERTKFLKPLRSLDYARIPYYVLGTAQELMGGERRVS